MAKDAPLKGDGPWGEAIQYWFKEKVLRQAHVVEGTGMPPNRVSRAANGLDVRMETLRRYAEFFGVPLESVLVSPLRRLGAEEQRHVVEKAAREALRAIDQRRPAAASSPRVNLRMLAIAKRLDKLPAKSQRTLIRIIAQYEKAAKREKGGGGGGTPPTP